MSKSNTETYDSNNFVDVSQSSSETPGVPEGAVGAPHRLSSDNQNNISG